MRKLAGLALALAALAAAATVAVPTRSAASGAAPGASTGAASSVTSATAVLGGSVNPNGSATSYYFQYGTTTAYGAQSAPASAGSGTTAVSASATIGGLSPDTTYHFRLVASSSAGTTDGADATFTSAKAPPTVATGAATLASATSAVLTGTVDPNGKPTTYVFQYGRRTSYGQSTPSASAGSGTAPVAVRATISGLSLGTTYHFRLTATSADGTVSGADATFASGRVPPTVTTSGPTVVTSDSAVLAGIVDPNGTATSYAFEYGATAAYGSQTPYTDAGSGSSSQHVSALVSGLTAGTTYHFRLVATSSAGSAIGADASLVTTTGAVAAGSTLPVVSSAAAVAVSATGAQLNGAINPAATSTTWYFEYGLTTGYAAQTKPQTMSGLGARPVNVHLAGLAPATTFHFRLVAQSGSGLYVGPDATFQTRSAVRLRPAGLTLTANSTPHRRGAALAISGTLAAPAALTAAQACSGVVAVAVARGPDIVSLRELPLLPNCTYAEQLTLAAPRLRGARRLSIAARFEGNAVLGPAVAPRIRVSSVATCVGLGWSVKS